MRWLNWFRKKDAAKLMQKLGKTATGPPDQEHERAIGRVTVCFSRLESAVAFFTWCIITPQDQLLGQIITAELSFRARLTLLDAVFRYLENNEKLIDELDVLLGQIQHVEDERNRLIHSA